jgi:N-acetylglucosaminyl-diphospho-decaprenol L-rhamnosyltransferase
MSDDAVSAVVVNYNAGDHLEGCVASLRSEGVDDVVVVDNGSSDGSVAALVAADPTVRVIRPGRNLGYGAGANAGARHARHGLLLVCNPDLVLHEGSLAALAAAAAARPDAAVVGPRVLTAEGEVFPSARSFPTIAEAAGHAFVGLVSEENRWTRRYKRPLADPVDPVDPGDAAEPAGAAPSATGATDVDWVSGACFLVRQEAFTSVGGFDEAYFMYVEDVDLCWRLRRAGWAVLYEPAAVVTHVQGVSTAHHPYRMAVAHHRSMWRFAARSSTGATRVALPVVAGGIVLRLGIQCARQAVTTRPRRGAGGGTPAPPR